MTTFSCSQRHAQLTGANAPVSSLSLSSARILYVLLLVYIFFVKLLSRAEVREKPIWPNIRC